MHQSLFKCEWIDVSIQLSVRECLVDIVEFHSFGSVIFIYRLQTGDDTEEGRSRKATKHNHRVVTVQLTQLERIAVGIVGSEIGQRIADFEPGAGQSVYSFSFGPMVPLSLHFPLIRLDYATQHQTNCAECERDEVHAIFAFHYYLHGALLMLLIVYGLGGCFQC